MAKKISRSDLLEIVRDYKSGHLSNRPMFTYGGGVRNPSTILVKNTTETEIKLGERLKVDDFLYSSDSLEEFLELHEVNGPCFTGSKPENGGFLVAAMESIPSGVLGRCIAPGVIIPSAINVVKEYHIYADFIGTEIKSGLAGPDRIIAKPTEIGEKWGYISLGVGWPNASYSGKLKTAITAGTEKSATVTVTITGRTETEEVIAYTFPGITVKAVAINKSVRIVFDILAQKWYFDKLDC